MSHGRYSREEVAERGRAIYEQQIRPKVEPEHVGKFLVIDIETGDYEMDENDVAAMKRAAQKHSADTLYGMRIGYRTMGRIGLRSAAAEG
jgi:hypothetical protein